MSSKQNHEIVLNSVIFECPFSYAKISVLNLGKYLTIKHDCNPRPWLQVSLVTRKPVFGVSDQLRLEPVCSATETS